MQKSMHMAGVLGVAAVLAATGRSVRADEAAAPDGLAGLKLWLRADQGVLTSGSSVTNWQDQSGNGYHVTQSVAGQQPELASAVINGLPVVRFTAGSSQYLSHASLAGGSTVTFFLVERNLVGSTGAAPFSFGASGGKMQGIVFQNNGGMQPVMANRGAYPYTSTSARIWCSTDDGAASSYDHLTMNGLPAVGGDWGAGSWVAPFAVGRRNLGPVYTSGDIAEIVIYNRVLSATERRQVERYLAERYGIPMPAASDTATVLGANAAAADDLVNQGCVSLDSIALTSGSEQLGSSLANLNDGDLYGGESPTNFATAWVPSDGAVVTITLDGRYTITNVVSLASAGADSVDQDRTSQCYDFAVHAVGQPIASYSNVFSVGCNSAYSALPAGAETRIEVSATNGQALASNVDQIRITFRNGYSVHAGALMAAYREFDIGGFRDTSAVLPNAIADLKLWLRADQGVLTFGSSVTNWQDQSGNGYHCTQTTPSAQPDRVGAVINGRPVVRFTAANAQYLSNAALSLNDACTFFLVERNLSGGTGAAPFSFVSSSKGQGIVFQNNGGMQPMSSQPKDKPPYNSTGARIWCLQDHDLTGHDAGYLNGGVAVPCFDLGAGSWKAPFDVGRRNLSPIYTSGDIAEIIVYSRLLSDEERHAVELYLSGKYGVAVQSGSWTAGAVGRFAADASDLLDAGHPALESMTVMSGSAWLGSSLGMLNDGGVYGGLDPTNFVSAFVPSDGTVVMIEFMGWCRIDRVVSLASGGGGYAVGQDRSSQRYTFAAHLRGTSGYTDLFSVYTPSGIWRSQASATETRVCVDGTNGVPLASAVDSVRLTFGKGYVEATGEYETMYRELEIYGEWKQPSGTVILLR